MNEDEARLTLLQLYEAALMKLPVPRVGKKRERILADLLRTSEEINRLKVKMTMEVKK